MKLGKPNMKLGKFIIALIWYYLSLFGYKISFLSIFSFIYLHLPLFTYIFHICPDLSKYAIFTLDRYSSIETAHLCKILEKSDDKL